MFAEILFPGHNLPLTYRIPEKLRKQILLYTRVQALLKEKKETGLLVGLHETQENTTYQILDILRVIDKSPIINSTQIRLAEKIKENYLCTLGDALFQMIPSGSRETFIEDKWVKADPSEQLFSLKPSQQKVIQDILEVVSKKSVSTHLLQGITGSGKTRVYLELVNYYLEAGYTVLYLVPEISLVLNFAVQFKNLFQDRISILHSGMKGSKKLEEYRKIMHGQAQLVLGTRSAVFAPLENLGLVIVDEEHDSSYKEKSGFYYQAKRIAWLRLHLTEPLADQYSPALVLGSATPSFESYHFAISGKFHHHKLLERATGIHESIVHVPEYDSAMGPISPFLKAKIEEHLKAGSQVILLLNRRGYANTMICKNCHAGLQCKRCAVSLTFHKTSDSNLNPVTGILKCHYCDHSEPVPTSCPGCGGKLKAIGQGTQKIEELIPRFFPNIPFARLDQDTGRDREQMASILTGMKSGEIKILVGTQMIAKGFDLPGVTLVGILNADTGLSMPDFRANERVFQITSQAAGRSGRHKNGEVVIQTLQPENPAINAAIVNDYEGLANFELSLRRAMGYPPFSRLIRIVAQSVSQFEAESVLEHLVKLLNEQHSQHDLFSEQKTETSFEILGPAPAPIERIKDFYRFHVILKFFNSAKLHETGQQIQSFLRTRKSSQLKIEIDLDPLDIL